MTLDDTEMLTQLVAVAPKEYQSVLTNYMMYNEDVKIQEIHKTLKHHYRALKISSKEDQMDNEVAFLDLDSRARCKKCGVFGHKAAKCPEKKKGNNASNKKENKIKIKGKCFNCGKEGHQVVDCWHKEENKDKPPRNFVAREISMADNSMVDVPVIALMAHESLMPRYEMTDLDLYPVSKQGLLLPKITLTNVLYVPDLSYNLFSINSALNKNMKLTASGKDGYMIHNDKVRLFFEHKIATSDSYLFASFMQ